MVAWTVRVKWQWTIQTELGGEEIRKFMITIIYRKILHTTKRSWWKDNINTNKIPAKYSWNDVLVRTVSKFYKYSRIKGFSDSFHLPENEETNLWNYIPVIKSSMRAKRHERLAETNRTSASKTLYVCYFHKIVWFINKKKWQFQDQITFQKRWKNAFI